MIKVYPIVVSIDLRMGKAWNNFNKLRASFSEPRDVLLITRLPEMNNIQDMVSRQIRDDMYSYCEED